MTRTSHMLAVAAVIMGATFIPIFGGLPRASEWAELRAVRTGNQDTVPDAQAVVRPQREAQRAPAPVQTAALANGDAELTTLELSAEAVADPTLLDADEVNVAPEAVEEGLELPVIEDESKAADEEPATPAA